MKATHSTPGATTFVIDGVVPIAKLNMNMTSKENTKIESTMSLVLVSRTRSFHNRVTMGLNHPLNVSRPCVGYMLQWQ